MYPKGYRGFESLSLRQHAVDPLSNPAGVHYSAFPGFKRLWHNLAEVRHDGRQKAAKSFRISSGNRRVYTTFAIQFEPLRKAEAKLLE